MQDGAPAETPRVQVVQDSGDSGGEAIGSPDLRIAVRRAGREAFVDLSGELDLASAPQLRELLVTMLIEDGPSRLVIDLSDLVYLDSTGLSVLVTAHKRASSTGTELTLANPNASVTRLLGITALDQIFDIVDAPEPATAPTSADGASQDEEATERGA
jgi:anti-sigma B factor antagonist